MRDWKYPWLERRTTSIQDFKNGGLEQWSTSGALQASIIRIGSNPISSTIWKMHPTNLNLNLLISKENTCGMQEIHAYGDLAKNDNIRQKPSRC